MKQRTTEHFFFARQPILDAGGSIRAYEFLYRNSRLQGASPLPLYATEQVVTNAMNLTGLGNLLGRGMRAFVNVNERMLFCEGLLSIPPASFVFELLERMEYTPAIVSKIAELHARGYRFALDDFVCSPDAMKLVEPVLPYIQIVKLEIGEELEKLREYILRFKELGMSVLAEKVENNAQFETLKRYGCDLFQGFFFARPSLVSGERLDPKLALIFRIIDRLDAQRFDDAVALFEQDAALTLQLLRYINSAAFSLRSDIRTIRQAIALLGVNPLKQWLTMISYALFSNEGLESPLLRLARERAAMMRVFAAHYIGEEAGEDAAFIGLLSLMDTLTGREMGSLLEELRIAPPIRAVLLHETAGLMGDLYRLCIAVERFDSETIAALLESNDLAFATFAALVNRSYQLSAEIERALQARR